MFRSACGCAWTWRTAGLLALDAAGRAGLYGRHRLPQAANPEADVEAASPTARRPAIRAWLYAVAALMVLTLVVGGATRLTEVRAFHRRVETGHRRHSAAVARGVAGGVRQVPADPAVPRTQPRHEPGRVQNHLLVGVEPSPAGAAGRRGVPVAVSVFSLARLDRAGLEGAAVDAVRRRRAARRRRLVDGVVGSRRPGQRVAISPGVPSDARLRDLCGDPLDRARSCSRASWSRCRGGCG